MAEIDKLDRTLRESGSDGRKLCEIEASAEWYPKNVRRTPAAKVAKFSKENDIVVIPFDKGTGFCEMNRQSHHKTWLKFLIAPKSLLCHEKWNRDIIYLFLPDRKKITSLILRKFS